MRGTCEKTPIKSIVKLDSSALQLYEVFFPSHVASDNVINVLR